MGLPASIHTASEKDVIGSHMVGRHRLKYARGMQVAVAATCRRLKAVSEHRQAGADRQLPAGGAAS